MKKIIISLNILLVLSCNSQSVTLSETELNLTTEIGLKQETAKEIKALSKGDFKFSNGNTDREFLFENFENLKQYGSALPKAVTINVDRHKVYTILKKYRDPLKSEGILIYVSDQNYGYEDDVITIIKSNNKFEALLFEATNAVNYDIYTPEIIETLQKWDSLYGIEIYGVGFDFVDGHFNKLPDNIKPFAEEMYRFCPDIVDQGTGSIEELIKELKKTKSLLLWWD